MTEDIARILNFDREFNLYKYEDSGAIWISEEDVKLQTRIVVVAHTKTGHAGIDEVVCQIRKLFHWSKIKAQVTTLSKKCLHCLSRFNRLVRRILGEQLSSAVRNGIIHMDYLFLVANLYLLVLKDDFSNKIDFYVTSQPTAKSTATAVLYWKARYGLRNDTMFVKDQGSHFANQFIEELECVLRVQHHFVVAYSPWSNGKIERVNKDILKSLRHLKSEFRVAFNIDVAFLLPNSQTSS